MSGWLKKKTASLSVVKTLMTFSPWVFQIAFNCKKSTSSLFMYVTLKQTTEYISSYFFC